MRYLLVFALVMAQVAVAVGQGTATPTTADKEAARKAAADQIARELLKKSADDLPKLRPHLKNWEAAMGKVETLSTKLERTDTDNTFKNSTVHVGYAQYMKTGAAPFALNLGVLQLNVKGKTELSEKYVCTGNYIYHFAVPQKELRAYEVPKPKPGQAADNSILGFLFGMKAADAERDYYLVLHSEDPHYVYVNLYPKFAEQKADFKMAQVVLLKSTYLPARLWFKSANGDSTQWDLTGTQVGVKLDRRTFDAPAPPAGWKLVPVVRQQAARPAGTPVSVPPAKARP